MAAQNPDSERSCFGTFLGNPTCKQCHAAKQCKAILLSHGFDIVGAMIENLDATLAEGVDYPDTAEPADLLRVLLQGAPEGMADSPVEDVPVGEVAP